MPKDEFDFDDPMELNGMAFPSPEPDAWTNLSSCETRKTKGKTK